MLVNKRPLAFFALGLFFIADRILKWWAQTHYAADISLFNGLLHLGYYPNPHLLFIINLPGLLSIGAMLAAFVFLLVFFHQQSKISPLAFYFILAGALSNFYDRLTGEAVIDFFKIFNLSTFNFADLLILMGLIIFIIKERPFLLIQEDEKKNI